MVFPTAASSQENEGAVSAEPASIQPRSSMTAAAAKATIMAFGFVIFFSWLIIPINKTLFEYDVHI
jgi:hypothetical protein